MNPKRPNTTQNLLQILSVDAWLIVFDTYESEFE